MAVVPVVPLWPRGWIVWLEETYFMEKIIQYLHHGRRFLEPRVMDFPLIQGQCRFSPLCLEGPPCLSEQPCGTGD